jgi:glycosyltransferase involved in cell wall biosynthesis
MNDCDLRSRIRIHLTIKANEREDLRKLIDAGGLQHNIVFHGPMPHEQLLSMYKASGGLLFPSIIETIGLPLLEAAAFGLPVLANNLEYVKNVLKGYDGLITVPLRDYKAWGENIAKLCKDKPRHNNYHREGGSDWPNIFKLIHG